MAYPLNIPQAKVSPYLMLNFNDPKSIISTLNFPSFKVFLSSMFKSTAPQRNLEGGFHCGMLTKACHWNYS
jgi:hypothetical protein